MKSFKEINESMALPSKYAKNVESSKRAVNAPKGQIGFLHFSHGADFDVFAPDSHDLAYFGKNVVRLKGRTTGKEQAAYVDWAKGTVSFSSGDHTDDLKFDKPVKFKKASLYEEAEENLHLYSQLAEDMEVSMPLEEAVELVKGKIYKSSTNDMLLKYTGRSKAVGTSYQPVFTVVDSSGKPRLVSGKRFEQSYGDSVLKNLTLVEAQTPSIEVPEETVIDEAAKPIRDRVIAYLVKKGSNEADATKTVDKNLNDALKVRPGATPAKLAEIVMVL
ncbi:hypothetical protein PHYNN_253 [Pantoea phage Phynn]|nr:hypothetical protein PHYNN_253 [Pantoea phage Phynn]